ncbi:helix-turn-helix domain-containing protein [Comamonas odontotermitis]|uniref:helix-turn-helix domain-containing protein n=1 Tax=Comamonas odontotermitis TaxID=379895 RepID=UPI00366F3BA1
MSAPSPRHANNPDLIALGATIPRSRLERKMSQEELAHRSDIDRAYMSSIERGLQNPAIVSIVGVVKALGLTTAGLMASAGL